MSSLLCNDSLLSRAFAALLFLLALSCGTRDTYRNNDIVSAFDSVFNRHPDFSGVALVAVDGKRLYHRAFGYADYDTRRPVDTTSVFELASVSKQFTAMVIMVLESEGLLQYEDPLEKYIPNFPYKGVTLKHLLNHTSGLPDYQAIMDEHWDKDSVADNDDNIRYMIRFAPPVRFAPGERFEYSNTGYMLLASVAEKASGVDFTSLCREKIFIRAGMKDTDIRDDADRKKLQSFAWGYIFVEERGRYVRADSFPEFNYTIWLGNREGPGRISSTASDLLAWDRALYTELILDKDRIATAFEPGRLRNGAATQYGLGWYLATDSAWGTTAYHTGDNPGYRSVIRRYPGRKATIILLSNNAHARFDQIDSAINIILKQRMR